MVVPPQWIAATPVGATTAVFLVVVFLMCFRKVVLPVPAFPVRKMGREVCVINSSANVNIILSVGITVFGSMGQDSKKSTTGLHNDQTTVITVIRNRNNRKGR